MKKVFPLDSRTAIEVVFPLFICLFSMLFSTGNLHSQGLDANGYLPDLSSIQWKTLSGIDQAIGLEQSRMDDLLNQPSIAPEDRALFLAYRRMTGHFQSAVQSGKPIYDAVLYGYSLTIAEAQSNALLKALPEGALLDLLPGLLELLIEIPVPAPAVAH